MGPNEFNGSLILYRKIIRPRFVQYEPKVDKLLSDASDIGNFLMILSFELFLVTFNLIWIDLIAFLSIYSKKSSCKHILFWEKGLSIQFFLKKN